jgi:hypothetical protein
MQTPAEIAEAYLAAWNATDGTTRLPLLENWDANARYRDPLMQADGREAIDAMIAAARERFAGLVFILRGTPDGHGAFARFSWDLAPRGGAPVAGGTDIVRIGEHGRIAEVIGFLDEVAS